MYLAAIVSRPPEPPTVPPANNPLVPARHSERQESFPALEPAQVRDQATESPGLKRASPGTSEVQATPICGRREGREHGYLRVHLQGLRHRLRGHVPHGRARREGGVPKVRQPQGGAEALSLIHISEPT